MIINEKMWKNFQLRADKSKSLMVSYRHFTIAKSRLLRELNRIEDEKDGNIQKK